MNTTDSTRRQLTKRLERAKYALDQIIKKILDINKAKKAAVATPPKQEEITDDYQYREELKLLNRIADQQAQLVRVYENQLQESY